MIYSMMARATTTLANAYAFPFSSRGIRLTHQSDSWAKRIPYNWGSEPYVHPWPHTFIEFSRPLIGSHFVFLLLMLQVPKASSRPIIIALYSASLLDAKKSRWMHCSIGSLVRESSTNPTLAPDALSACKIHQWSMLSVCTHFLG